VATPQDKIQNVILCEDIRDEIGNKKSLMGIMGGDILVAQFPATLQIAVYFEYAPDPDERDDFALEFRVWQGDVEIGKGAMQAPLQSSQVVSLVLPRALVGFEQEGSFRITASIRGGEEFEILNKKFMKAPTS
jgi:hypothetical protein